MTMKDKLDKRNGNLVGWAIKYQDGSEWVVPGDICYAALTRKISKQVTEFSTHATCMKNNKILAGKRTGDILAGYTDKELEYVDFVANKSFVSHVFLTKDPKEIVVDGFDIDVNVSPQEAIAAATLIRYVAEYPQRVRMFHEFLPYVGGNHALVFCGLLDIKEHNGKTYFTQAWPSGHQFFGFHCSIPQFQNMVRGKVMNKTLQPFAKSCNYYGLMSPWETKSPPDRYIPAPQKPANGFKNLFKNRGLWEEVSIPGKFGFNRYTVLAVSIEEYAKQLLKENWPDDKREEGLHTKQRLAVRPDVRRARVAAVKRPAKRKPNPVHGRRGRKPEVLRGEDAPPVRG